MGQNYRLLSATRLPKVHFQYTLIRHILQVCLSIFLTSRVCTLTLSSASRYRGIIFNHYDRRHLTVITKWIVNQNLRNLLWF